VTRQEQLCAFVMRAHGRGLTQTEIARPWTYLHRQWTNEKGQRCADCTGVLIERDDGSMLRFNVAEMDVPQGALL